MIRGRLVAGFDYVAQRALELTRSEWRHRLAAAISKGGRRRFDRELRETFAHGRDGLIVFECYDNIGTVQPAP